MKSLVALICISGCFAQYCFAQQRYTAPGRVVYTSPGGFGNVAYPGTGAAPQPNFGNRVGSAFSGRSGFQGGRRTQVYAYPVFVGGGYGYYGDPGYGYAPQGQGQAPVNVTVVNAPPQVPNVIINQNFGPQQPGPQDAADSTETTRIYRTPSPAVDNTPDATPQPHYFLVALKDHSVFSAFAYWIEDKTLHYVTPQQTHNQASLDLVDLDLTKQLNQR